MEFVTSMRSASGEHATKPTIVILLAVSASRAGESLNDCGRGTGVLSWRTPGSISYNSLLLLDETRA
jgi:hypothetical protein